MEGEKKLTMGTGQRQGRPGGLDWGLLEDSRLLPWEQWDGRSGRRGR